MSLVKLSDGSDLYPYKGKLVIMPFEFEGTAVTEGGVILSDVAKQWVPPQQGKVIAVGDEVDGIEEGDVVLYGLGAPQAIALHDKIMYVISASAVVGTLDTH